MGVTFGDSYQLKGRLQIFLPLNLASPSTFVDQRFFRYVGVIRFFFLIIYLYLIDVWFGDNKKRTPP